MSSDDSDRPDPSTDEANAEADAQGGEPSGGDSDKALAKVDETSTEGDLSVESPVAGHIGVQRYVHAAFFALGILSAYLSGKLLLSAWNSLANWPEAVRQVPFLIEYSEQERASMTLVIGAVVGLVAILRYYRRPAVRSWAMDVAGELARVTWPEKETVSNGTIVVLIAAAIATLYIAVLDRFWGYLTNLIY